MNLLAIALSAQPKQTVGYYEWTGRTKNTVGKLDDTFAARRDVVGSFQPVSRDRMQANGLDFSRSYATFYATGSFSPVVRDEGADRFAFNGRLYTAEGKVDWFGQDGWDAVLLVDIGPDPDA